MDPVLVASPFLKDSHEFQQQQPSSASSSAHFSTSHPDSPYEGFTFEQDFIQENHHFPHTPSYNGSYQNSPYSVASDLPAFDNPDALDFSSFDNRSAQVGEEYDPSDFDIPNGPSLLTFDESFMPGVDTVSVAITPPFDQTSPNNGYDHSSPASSAGEDGRRSRASSTSSYMHPNSPPMDFASSFENTLHFDSPAWPASGLPNDRPSPPAQKPQSPPQLVIPESPSMAANDEPPTINAPEGDGMPGGPQLHIVPATPISGGGGVAQNVPFLQQGGSQDPSNTWDQAPQHLVPTVNQSMAPSAQYTDQSQNYYTGSNPSSPGMSFANPNASESAPAAEQSRHQQFLVPQIPVARSRSLSDTSLRPPIWNTAPMAAASGSAVVDTVNMNDVLPGPGSASPSPSPAPGQRHPTSAGPHQTTFGNTLIPPQYSYANTNAMARPQPSMSTDFLTPDIGAAQLRRVKSDSVRPQFGHRQSRSEDIRYSTSLASTTAGFPPPGAMSQEYLRMNSNRQFLHPTQAVIPIAARSGHRRSSSTSRERPMGWSSGASSARASPYPSPSASPRPGYGPLPGADYSPLGGMARLGMGPDGLGLGGMVPPPGVGDGPFVNVAGPGQPEHKIAVSKVNVTTPSTADASQKRRKQPANFQCPVPGCGSTFTRHFNLKGHLRSHAEEKPYQCKWPGCGKGFARQHDCKRHENLHLNIRPYPCEGCKKNFARMDALNRHLRSEGGAECRKIQKEMKPTGDEGDMAALMMKNEPDDSWSGNGVMV